MARDSRLRLGDKLALAATERSRAKDAAVDPEFKHLPKGDAPPTVHPANSCRCMAQGRLLRMADIAGGAAACVLAGSHIETRALALLRKLQTVHEKSLVERSKPVRLSGRKRGAAAMTSGAEDGGDR